MGQRDILLTVAKLLRENNISYFLSGGFASSYYGFPRATHDVDFILEIEVHEFEKVQRVLKKLHKSFLVDLNQAKEAIEQKNQFNVLDLDSGIKVDFWPVVINEFNKSRFRRKKEKIFDKQKIWLISPEDLILMKLLWCKEIRSERHLRDCTGIIQVQGKKLDQEYLRHWVEKLKIKDLFSEVSSADNY